MGLTWTGDGYARRCRDASGKFYAQVTGQNGKYGIYFAPWACGREGGLWLDGYTTPDEATTAAEQYVAAHLDESS